MTYAYLEIPPPDLREPPPEALAETPKAEAEPIVILMDCDDEEAQ